MDPDARYTRADDGTTTTSSYCRLCVAECGILVTTRDERVVSIRGDAAHPISRGYVCPKGRALAHQHDDARRLDVATVGRGSDRRVVAAGAALDDLCRRLASIVAEHGPDAVGVYIGTGGFQDSAGSSAALRLAAELGTRSLYTPMTIDGVAKHVVNQMVTGASGLYASIDLDHATLAVFWGCNPVVSHGHDWGLADPVRRLRELSARGEVWVFDPRQTETARLADRHVPLRPGSDHVVLASVVRELLVDGYGAAYVDAHVEGIDALRAAVEPFTVEVASAAAGVPRQDLADFVAAIRRHGRIAAVSGTGATFGEHAVLTEWLLFALHALTGSIDRRGGRRYQPGFWTAAERLGPQSLPRGGSPGPKVRPDLPSWSGQMPTATIAAEIAAGNLRALLCLGGNPLASFPNRARVEQTLQALDVLVVADIVASDISERATHVLPCRASLERADRTGGLLAPTVFAQYSPALVPSRGDRRPLWWHVDGMARRLGLSVLDPSVDPDTATDLEVLRYLTAGDRASLDAVVAAPHGVVLDLDDELEDWVVRTRVAGGRFDLCPAPLIARLEQTARHAARRESVVLLNRRQLRHINSTMRDFAPPAAAQDMAVVYVHPIDATAVGVADGGAIVVRSAHGTVSGVAQFDPSLPAGAVALPFGFAEPNANFLIGDDDLDPLSGMPRFSGLPVTIEAASGLSGPADRSRSPLR